MCLLIDILLGSKLCMYFSNLIAVHTEIAVRRLTLILIICTAWSMAFTLKHVFYIIGVLSFCEMFSLIKYNMFFNKSLTKKEY